MSQWVCWFYGLRDCMVITLKHMGRLKCHRLPWNQPGGLGQATRWLRCFVMHVGLR